MDELMASMSFVYFFLGVYRSEWLKFDFSFCMFIFIYFVYFKYFNLFAYHIFDVYGWYFCLNSLAQIHEIVEIRRSKCNHSKIYSSIFLSFIFLGNESMHPIESIYIEGFKVNSFSCRIPIFCLVFFPFFLLLRFPSQYRNKNAKSVLYQR